MHFIREKTSKDGENLMLWKGKDKFSFKLSGDILKARPMSCTTCKEKSVKVDANITSDSLGEVNNEKEEVSVNENF